MCVQVESPHAIIGILIFIFLWMQPLLGFIHHSNFKKFQRRTGASFIHLWIGRVAITLGIINGGLGFLLAGTYNAGVKLYAVLAAFIWIGYVAAVFLGERKRSQVAAQRAGTLEKGQGQAIVT
jgi:hypothetical protein